MKYENVTMKGNANKFRFSLTKEGDRKLVVFGVNPSTANEQIADLTITKVMGFAERNGFDGFIMLNLYPQRCTNPRSLDKEIDEDLQRKNLEAIRLSVGDMKEPIVLLGFGDTINLRPYLKRCLKEIIDIAVHCPCIFLISFPIKNTDLRAVKHQDISITHANRAVRNIKLFFKFHFSGSRVHFHCIQLIFTVIFKHKANGFIIIKGTDNFFIHFYSLALFRNLAAFI